MKKNLLRLFLYTAITLPAIGLQAQTEGSKIYLPESLRTDNTHNAARLAQPGHQGISSTTCGIDTILYPYLKELAFTAPNDSFFIDAMVGNVRTASQSYLTNGGTVNVYGVQFWGGAYSVSSLPKTLQVRVYLYNVDAMYKPISVVDSATVTVTNAYDFYTAIFPIPHVMSSNFAVGAKSIPNDTLTVITNNAGNAWTPDYGEGLAWRRFGSGVWNSTLSFFGQDLEYMIFPIVDYTINASFAASTDTACTNAAVTYNNTSSPILSNRMFNLRVFDQFWGFAAADSTFKWNYTSGGPWTYTDDGSYTYPAAGAYPAILAAEMLGYYTTCLDSMGVNTFVYAPYTMNFFQAICNGDTIHLGSQTLTTAGTYSELFQSMAGCDSSVTINLTIHPTYSVTANASICNGEIYIFGPQVLSSEGTYTQVFPTVSGCDSLVTLTLDIDTIYPSIVLNGGTLTGDPSATDWQWIDCNIPAAINGETNQTYTPTSDGFYAVISTINGCSDTSECISVSGVGLKNKTASLNSVSVFPNPTNGTITVSCNGLVPDRITVTNILGEIIRNVEPDGATTRINLQDQPATVYYVNILYKEASRVVKLVKQ
jgi:hypothetical protein